MARRVPVSAATREYDKIMGSRMRIAVEASRGASTDPAPRSRSRTTDGDVSVQPWAG